MSQEDVALTPTGMPKLRMGDVEYPLFVPVSGMKAFAEKRGMTFKEMVTGGWSGPDLDIAEIEFLLLEALAGGERRRQMFSRGEPRAIDESLVAQILDIHHISDVWDAMILAWNQRPEGPDAQDPPISMPPPDGMPSSD